MRHRARQRASAAALGVIGAALTLLGCHADARDFAEQAQRFIVFDADLAELTGVAFTKAVCTSPPTTAPGTTFACTANADDGREWTFTVTIGRDGTYAVAVDGAESEL